MSQAGGGGDPPRNPGPYPNKKVKLKKGDTKKTTPAACIEEFNPEAVFTFRGGNTSHFQREWAVQSGWPTVGSSEGSDTETSYGSSLGNCGNANDPVSSLVPSPNSLAVDDAKTSTSNMETEVGRGPTIPRHYLHRSPGTQAGRGSTIPRQGVSRPKFSPASRTGRFSSATQTQHMPLTVDETRKGWGYRGL